jgi:hypothetical protein
MNVLVQSIAATALTAALFAGGFSLDGGKLKGKLPQNESKKQTIEVLAFNDVEMNCVEAFKLTDQVVINSQPELNKWYKTTSERGEGCELPVIDFTKESLVILKVNAGGCDVPTLAKTVSLNKDKKVVTVQMDIQQNGYCKMLHVVPVYFTIPKVADGFKIELKQNKTYK